MWGFHKLLMISFVLATCRAQFLEDPNQRADDTGLPNPQPDSEPAWNTPESGDSPTPNDPSTVGLKNRSLFPRLFKHGLNWIKRNWIKQHWAQPAWLHPGQNGQKRRGSQGGRNPAQFYPNPYGPNSSGRNPNQDRQVPNWNDPRRQHLPKPNVNPPNPTLTDPSQGGLGAFGIQEDFDGFGSNDGVGDLGGKKRTSSNSKNFNQEVPSVIANDNLDELDEGLSELNPEESNFLEKELTPDDLNTLDNDINPNDFDFNWRNSNSKRSNSNLDDLNVLVRKPRRTTSHMLHPGQQNGRKFLRPRPTYHGYRPNTNVFKPSRNVGPGRSNFFKPSATNTGNLKLNKWNQLE